MSGNAHRSAASGASSKVTVKFLQNRITFFDYQKEGLLDTIAKAAEKLGMSGEVIAVCIDHSADTGNAGRSTFTVDVRKPLVPNCDQLFRLRIRTSYNIPSILPSMPAILGGKKRTTPNSTA